MKWKFRMSFDFTLITAVISLTFFSACSEDLNRPPNNIPAPNRPPDMPANPSPADGASGIMDDFILTWQGSDPDGDLHIFNVYFGTDSLLPSPICRTPYNYYRSPWQRQRNTQMMLQQIYLLQTAYHAAHGAYCLNGAQTHAGDSSFATLGFYPEADDWYWYLMVADLNTFTCMASANLDNDADVDTWEVNDVDEIRATLDDLWLNSWLFEPFTAFYWRVVAVDDSNNQTAGPTWSFVARGDSSIFNVPPEIPTAVWPPDGVEGIAANFSFSWDCSDRDGDLMLYDLYYSLDPQSFHRQSDIFRKLQPSPWHQQARAIEMLGQIYHLQKAYRNQHSSYCLNGECAWYYDNGFAILNVVFDSLDSYWYCMTADSNTFTCLAANNLDDDSDTDIWVIDSDSVLVSQENDLAEIPFLPNTIYYWRIAARDGHGHTTLSPIWTFISANFGR